MNLEQFKLVLEFYKLIKSGPKINIEIERLASDILIKDDSILLGANSVTRKAGRKLATAIKDTHDSLTWWSDDKAYRMYTRKSIKKPSEGAFSATWDVIHDDITIHAASLKYSVNYQSIKVLMPRLERYIDYADRLQKLSK